MKLENTCVVQVPRQKLWDYLIVIPNVAQCLPGVEEVLAVDERNYTGAIQVKVGIVKLKLRGKIMVEFIDNDRYVASLAVQAAD
ncbi:MAG: CoxG family protein, partial [Terriglobia bacterium]